MFFIGENLKHIHMTYCWTFDLLLINSRYSVYNWSLFLTTQKKYCIYVNTDLMGNQSSNTYHELVYDIGVEKT